VNRLPARTEKKFGERETEEFGERSDRGGTRVAPSLRWGSPGACSQASAKPVGRRTIGLKILRKVLQVSEMLVPDRKRGLQMSIIS